MKSIIIKIRETDLNDDGRWLLDLARHQDRHLAVILQPRNGIIYAEINDEATDDILRVRVDDQLGHAERVRRFGGGTATKVDPEIQEEKFELHAMTPATRRLWFVPAPLIKRATQDPEQGAAIVNQAGEALRGWCAEGGFIPWRDPDWVSQAMAADVTDVPTTTINNAVRVGQLATWHDMDEPNPQRRTRVRLSEVKKRWPTHLRSASRQIWQHTDGSCYTVLVDRAAGRVTRAVGPYAFENRNEGLEAVVPPTDNGLADWVNDQPEGTWDVVKP